MALEPRVVRKPQVFDPQLYIICGLAADFNQQESFEVSPAPEARVPPGATVETAA